MKKGEMALRACTCKDTYQDKAFGKGKRACNMKQGKNYKAGAEQYRCTNCGSDC